MPGTPQAIKHPQWLEAHPLQLLKGQQQAQQPAHPQ